LSFYAVISYWFDKPWGIYTIAVTINIGFDNLKEVKIEVVNVFKYDRNFNFGQ
jgi:hypothetical protein